MPETRRYTREEIEEYIRVGRLHDWGRANAMLRQLLADNAALRGECRWSRRKLIGTGGGFMVGGSLEDTLGLHNARAATDAAGALEDR